MTKQKALQISQSILLIVVGVLIACSLLNANILNYILASAILIYAILYTVVLLWKVQINEFEYAGIA